MKQLIFFVIATLLLGGCDKNPSDFLITKYGASERFKHINTDAINNTIQACHEAGGGRVIVPAGTWYSGTIRLLSDVELHLMSGAVLRGSSDIDDFRNGEQILGLITCFNAKNVSITGNGIIDGNGTIYHDTTRAHDAGDFNRKFIRQGEAYMKPGFDFSDGPIFKGTRPGMTMVFMSCERVRIEDIKMVDCPSWSIRLGDCDDVQVHGISIHNNLLVPNSDGIHCTHSRNVRISDCDIRAGDDAIIVTGFGNDIGVDISEGKADVSGTIRYGNLTEWTENVVVTNCLLQSRSAGIRVGYGEFPIRNCIFSNLVIYDSNRGIGVFARDNADIEHIFFDNIIIRNRIHSGHWWGNGEPIHVSTMPQQAGLPGGDIRDIRFSNIIADSETGILVWGSDLNRISDISFSKVKLNIHRSDLAEEYGGNVDLRPVLEEKDMIFAFDIPGMYVQNTDGLSVSEFELNWDDDVPEYHTYGIELKDVRDHYIDARSSFGSRPGSGLPALKID